jgi:hypothetical protein
MKMRFSRRNRATCRFKWEKLAMWSKAFAASCALVLSAGAAFASCHSAPLRLYQEYLAFKRTAPADALKQSAALITEIDQFFTTRYPAGYVTAEPSDLTAAEVERQQAEVTSDYAWLQARLVQLRANTAAVAPDAPALVWLSQVELPVKYGVTVSASLLNRDLPALARYSPADSYARAKVDAVTSACAASLEMNGKLLTVEPGSRAFYATCGAIQSPDKQSVGHYRLTHAILDNLTALLAHENRLRPNWNMAAAQ